jgi:hypothetical protein
MAMAADREEPSMTISRRLGVAAALAAMTLPAGAQDLRAPSPPDARVYFINLKDGDTVNSPFLVQFGLSGMGVSPADQQPIEINRNTGHHHLLINIEFTGLEAAILPMTDNIRHFGRGQTEAMITLPAGTHTLQLVLADWRHVPHNPPVVSERIRITVR